MVANNFRFETNINFKFEKNEWLQGNTVYVWKMVNKYLIVSVFLLEKGVFIFPRFTWAVGGICADFFRVL